jgi:hypothetical protein
MSEHELDVLLFGTTCRLRLEPMVLDLAQAFGTSHSKTTQRTNALVTVSIGDVSGYGESGLPPKKRGIYLAGANKTTPAVLFYAAPRFFSFTAVREILDLKRR